VAQSVTLGYRILSMKFPQFKIILFLHFFFFLSISQAAPLKDLPGAIPLAYERQAASDLVFNGKVLLPDEARNLFESKKISDLSILNPIETSVLWKNKLGWPIKDDLKELEVENHDDELEFISDVPDTVERMSFVAQKKFKDGRVKIYQVFLDLKGHNMVLRKNLLQKIGYQVPPISRVSKVKVKFKGAFSKREFFKDIKLRLFVDPSRWVISDPETEDEYLTLQDVFLAEGPDDQFYNLAKGDMEAEIIQGRRLLNSLLVPFSMTDVPQSLNLMSWTGGQIFNDQLLLPYADAEVFTTSYEDARWIARRIVKLSLQDWDEIVKQSSFPVSTHEVLKQKLLSRRNFLREKLNLQNESTSLEYNTDVTLQNPDAAKVNPEDGLSQWPGYARQFDGLDPESPLSRQEILGFFRSKLMSNILSNLLNEFNLRFLPKTDLDLAIFNRAFDNSVKQFAEFLMTREVKKTPLGFWSTKYYNTQLILSREIISGNYLGTENRIQLADTIGFAVDGGLYFQGEGLPTNVGASGKAKVYFYKTYNHLKPLSSIRTALKEPFKNIMVPYLKRKTQKPLNELIALDKKKNILDPEELQKQIDNEIENFTKNFGIGESLITTTSLGPELNFQIGKSFSEYARIFSGVQDRFVNIQRTHVFRKDKNTVQVYIDPAHYNIFSLSLGFAARIPIVQVNWNWQNGGAKTFYFDVNIEPDLEKNPQFFENIAFVAASMKGADTEFLKKQINPWLIKHNFKDRSTDFSLLLWKFKNATTTDKIRVTNQDGKSADFIRRLKGTRSGTDIESLSLDVANAALREFAPDWKVQLESNNSGNPGDTYLGSSITRQIVVEAQLVTGQFRWDNIYSGIVYRWKGWEIKQKKLFEILTEIEKMFGKTLFSSSAFADTKSVQFYNIEMQISLYQKAFEHVVRLNGNDIRNLFAKHEKQTNYGDAYPLRQSSGWENKLISTIKKLRNALQSSRQEESVKLLAEAFSIAENQLTFRGFAEFVGGIDNLFVQGNVRGFRVGSEAGDQVVYSESIGQIGSFAPFGPLQNLQRNMNISSGEFFLSWIINPL
jgi:hypothetical protein